MSYHRIQTMVTYPPDLINFVRERIRPFLNPAGLKNCSIEHLMIEAYIQGLKDAMQALEGEGNGR